MKKKDVVKNELKNDLVLDRNSLGWIPSREMDKALQKLSGADQVRLRMALRDDARWRGEL